MKPGRLLLALIFIIAILTTSSLAAIRTVSYNSSIPPNLVGTWTGNHTLDYFNPALGRLISVNFTVTLNATTSGTATNQAGSPVACASMLVTTDMDVAMINGDMLFLNVNLKIPSNGSCVTVPGHGSFSGSDNNSTVGYVFYSNPTDIDDYIGTGTFDLLGSFTGDSDISGGGSFSSSILTYGWSNSTITYTYNDALCLSGYKKDGCTGLPLSGWNITVRNSSWQRNATTNSSGFWAVCNLTPGSYWVNETTKSGWMNTTPASQSLLLGYLNRTVNFFNIPISNFTISKTAAPERS